MVERPHTVMVSAEPPREPPVGWRSAVAMLRTGIRRVQVLEGLQADLGLSEDEAAEALAYAAEWLRARRP